MNAKIEKQEKRCCRYTKRTSRLLGKIGGGVDVRALKILARNLTGLPPEASQGQFWKLLWSLNPIMILSISPIPRWWNSTKKRRRRSKFGSLEKKPKIWPTSCRQDSILSRITMTSTLMNSPKLPKSSWAKSMKLAKEP